MDAQPLRVEVDGTALAGDRWELPAAGPTLVLLHAGVADRRSWREVIPLVRTAGTVVAYDRRGYGETPASSEQFTDLADLLAVLDAVDDEPVWLVGSSMGGGVALDAAVAAPQRVAGLVLLAPAVSGAPAVEDLDPDTQRIADRLDAAMKAGDLDAVNRLDTQLWLDGPTSPAGRVAGPARDLALAMNRVVLDNAAEEDAGPNGVDAWAHLGEISLPVTVACGDLDVPFLADRCHELARRLPAARDRTLPGVAHLPYLERPGAVAELIDEAVAASG